ncbi:MAG TPA: hypothetical protein PLZ94_17455 [Armatimonadota bacterium]|nr:hypothetical protein [Armatimonadota bacterium]
MATVDAVEVMEEIVTEEPMRNHNHDLIQVLSEKLDGVVRYPVYHEDTVDECEVCMRIWEQIKQDDMRHVEMLRDEIIRHAKEGTFD